MVKTGVTSKGGGIDRLKKDLEALDKVKVLVGIPEETSAREGEPVTNAQLAYIHTHGSPARNLPPRPIIEPAIELPENKEAIAKQLSLAGKYAMDGDKVKMLFHVKLAGQQAANRVRAWFTDSRNGWGVKKNGDNCMLIDTGDLRKSITYVVEKA